MRDRALPLPGGAAYRQASIYWRHIELYGEYRPDMLGVEEWDEYAEADEPRRCDRVERGSAAKERCGAMRLVLHGAWTSSVPNLGRWAPEDPKVFCEIVCVDIGTGPRSRGTDIFSLTVATPRGLLARTAVDGVVLSGPVLVLDDYDFGVLWAWLEATVRACEAGTWDESVERLRRWFRWEYDDRA